MMRLPLERLPKRSPVLSYLVGLGLILSFCVFFFWPHPPASLLLLGFAAALVWMRLEIAIALLPLTFPYYLDLQPLAPSGFPAFSLTELGLFFYAWVWHCCGIYCWLKSEARAGNVCERSGTRGGPCS